MGITRYVSHAARFRLAGSRHSPLPYLLTYLLTTYYLLQCIGLLLVSSVCVSLSLAPKIRLAYKGTTAGEEAKGGGSNSVSNTGDGTKNTSDGNTHGSVASSVNNNKKMQQVRAHSLKSCT